MVRVKKNIRVLMADSISDSIVRIYKDLIAKDPDGPLARDPNLPKIMSEIEDLSQEITIAIRRDKIQTGLSHLDQMRDQAISHLFTIIAGYTAFPDPQKQEAAQALMAVTAKYKGIRNEVYAAKSVLIESMLHDFSADSKLEKIALLDGVQIRIDELRAVQDEFYKENDQINLQAMNKGRTASVIKSPLLTAINDKLIAYLGVTQAFDGYQEFIQLCELEINKVNASMGKKKAEEPLGEDDSDSEEESK